MLAACVYEQRGSNSFGIEVVLEVGSNADGVCTWRGENEMAALFEICAGAITGRRWISRTIVVYAVPGRGHSGRTAGAVPSGNYKSKTRWCDQASGAI